MMRALWSAASGMIAQQTNVDTISNNIANVNTTGYKTEKTEFKSLLYQNLQARTTTANGANKPIPAQVGLDGVILTNSDGYPVLDSRGNMIRIPDGVAAEKVSVTSQGQFYYRNAQGNPVDMNQSIGLFQFNNPGGLEKLQDSLLRVTDASGNPMNEATTAGLDRSNVRQGYLEGSNVQVADEMVNLIIAQRAYELNSKAIQASDDMLSQANQLRR